MSSLTSASTSPIEATTEARPARARAQIRPLLREGLVRGAQALLRFVWLVVVPLLLALVMVRHGVPGAVGPDAGSFEQALSRLAVEQPVLLSMAFFVLFAIVVHYWRFWLPGGRFLARLPPEVAARAARDDLVELSRGWDVRRAFSGRARKRLELTLGPERTAALVASLRELDDALAAADARRVKAAREATSELSRSLLRARLVWRGALSAGLLILAAAAALFVRSSVFEANRVVGVSMVPTLQPGDHVAGNKLVYGLRLPGASKARTARDPRRGDVAVFRHQGSPTEPAGELVKRIVGLPGDRVATGGGHLLINGWLAPFCYVGQYYYRPPGGATVNDRMAVEFLDDAAYLIVYSPRQPMSAPYEVKSGEVFVLGDNRSGSLDSRSFNQGLGGGVPITDILGRAERLVAHRVRNGQLALDTLFQPFSAMRLNLDGVDTSDLEATIKTCLSKRPNATKPPRESAPMPARGPRM